MKGHRKHLSIEALYNNFRTKWLISLHPLDMYET